MEELLKRKKIFDVMYEAAIEKGQYTFTQENISIEFHAFLMIFKKNNYSSIGVEPLTVEFHSLRNLFFYDDKVNFHCLNKKDFYISEYHMWEDQKDFNEDYLDELTIQFYNVYE